MDSLTYINTNNNNDTTVSNGTNCTKHVIDTHTHALSPNGTIVTIINNNIDNTVYSQPTKLC